MERITGNAHSDQIPRHVTRSSDLLVIRRQQDETLKLRLSQSLRFDLARACILDTSGKLNFSLYKTIYFGIINQVEEPMNRGSKKMQRWYFRSYDVTVIRIWSSWLVNATEVAWDDAPANLTKLKLEEPDPNYMEVLPKIDILVISSGHWFAKRTAYIMGGEVVGGQQWSPKKKKRGRMMKKVEAFAIAMRTAMKAILEEEGLKKGVVVLRTFSPDHYEGGAWDGGGSCTGKTRPALVVKRDEHTELMRKVQLEAFQEAIKIKNKNKVELKVLDVTRVFETRPDGHPGPYRNRDPNKITSPILGPHGHLPPPQDCLHWCMPGPIDTWSHLLLAILSSST